MADRTKEQIEADILAEIEKGTPYSHIAKKYNVGKGTINRIKNRSVSGDIKVAKIKPSKRTVATRAKIAEVQIQRHIVKNSEIIVLGMIDILQGLNYAVNNLVEINEDARTKVDEIYEKLDGLLVDVKVHLGTIELNEKEKDIGKDALVKAIYYTLSLINSYYAKQKIRIDATNALKEQMKMFMDYEISAKALKAVKEVIESFFKGLNILKDNEYKLVRDRIIELNPETRDLFIKYETEVV